ncbi:uncharacterized protein LOC143299347 [Babylonia areolata]|uniref:uncharacterized protein LOC143299347 n=1 Tax=Babylonia areolata TaxID=304850 RepID=UPI003FD19E10
MDGMLGIHSYLKSRRAQKVKENVDPNTTAAAKETEPGLVKSTDNGEYVDRLRTLPGFEKVGPSDWHRLSAREKRLLAVNYIFRSVEARSEGLTPDDPKEESWRDYVYGSSSGNTFAPTAWSSLMSLFSPGETAAGAGKQPAATEEAAKAEGCGVPSAATTTTTVAGEAAKTGGQKPGDADASEKAAAEGTGRYVTILGERIPEDELGVQDLDDSFEVLAREVGPSGEVAETGV